MDVKQAVSHAKKYVLELFEEEKLSNVGLEEVEFDERANEWTVTIGFSRPWDESRNALAALAASSPPRRTYKTVRIANDNGRVVSVKNREAQS